MNKLLGYSNEWMRASSTYLELLEGGACSDLRLEDLLSEVEKRWEFSFFLALAITFLKATVQSQHRVLLSI